LEQEPFTDYYEILQVGPNAEQETIERVYRLLAKRYHPDNGGTGDPLKFDMITKAYRVLSDSQRRKEYDANYQESRNLEWNSLFHTLPSGSAEKDKRIYQGILSILYIARRRDALNAGVGVVDLEKMLGFTEKQLEFHIWYLKEKGWIERLDNGGFAITVSGVDAVIEKDLLLRKDRFLPAAEEYLTEGGEGEG
jgi:curved DNA-binding protein